MVRVLIQATVKMVWPIFPYTRSHHHQDFSNLSYNDYYTPTYLKENGKKVTNEPSSPPSNDDNGSDSEIDYQLEENMIKTSGKTGYTKIKSLTNKSEKRNRSLGKQEELLIQERNLTLETSLVGEKKK